MFLPRPIAALLLLLAAITCQPAVASPRLLNLIHLQSDGKLAINSDTSRWLASQPMPLHVVTVTGPYHSGKSYFLNQLTRTSAFPVGHSTEPTTKGMDLLLLPSDSGGGGGTLYIDTEGMSATDTKLNHDAKIFTLAALLSDVLIFNTMSTIDTASLDLVEMLARHARLWQLKSHGRNFAQLLWTVQAFTLRHLEGEDATQWLIRVLHQQRSGLEDVFAPVMASTLRFPTSTVEDLHSTEAETTRQYLQDLAQVRELLAQSFDTHAGRSGREIVDWLTIIVQALNEGTSAEEIPSIWEAFFLSQLTQAKKEAIKTFETLYASSNNGNDDGEMARPLSPKQLVEAIGEAYDAAMLVFDTATFGLRTSDTSSPLRNETIASIQQVVLNAYTVGLDRARVFVKDVAKMEIATLQSLANSRIVLPVPGKQLQFQFDALAKDTMRKWNQLANEYGLPTDGDKQLLIVASRQVTAPIAFAEEIRHETRQLQAGMDLVLIQLSEQNRKLWISLAQESEEAAMKQFIQDTVLPISCHTTRTLQALLEGASARALDLFKLKLVKFKLEPEFETRLNSLQYKLVQARDLRTRENADCIETKCGELMKKSLLKMSNELADVLLPQSQDKLERAIYEIGNSTARYFAALVNDNGAAATAEMFSQEPGCRTMDLERSTKFTALVTRTVRANIDAVTLFFGAPLREAKREAEAELQVKWFSSFREDVRRLGVSKINKQRVRGNRVEFEELIQAAVEHWLNTEMDFLVQTKRRQWYQAFALNVAVLVLALSGALYVWNQLVRPPAAPERNTREWFMRKSMAELRELAQNRGINVYGIVDKAMLIELLLLHVQRDM